MRFEARDDHVEALSQLELGRAGVFLKLALRIGRLVYFLIFPEHVQTLFYFQEWGQRAGGSRRLVVNILNEKLALAVHCLRYLEWR